MCKAFSCLVKRDGTVIWKFGSDSHSDLQEEFGLKDNTSDPSKMEFARVEITPRNGDYLNPDKWDMNIDEQIQPTWWSKTHVVKARRALKEWRAELDKVLICKPIIDPFQVEPPSEITKEHLTLLRDWAPVRASVMDSVWVSVGDSAWDSVWASVGDSVRDSVWASVGDSVWASVRASVMDSVWVSVGDSVRDSVWASVWASVWDSVRDSVWVSVWASVWAYISSFFNLPRGSWKYTEGIECAGDNPFQPCIDLWELGLVSSYDGKIWRLHGGPKGEVLWQGVLPEGEQKGE